MKGEYLKTTSKVLNILLLMVMIIPYRKGSANYENPVLSSFDCNTVIDVPPIECTALVQFYNNTNGIGWTNQANWLISTTVENWYGITVASGHVTRIEMRENNLLGTFPNSLLNLSSLIILDFYNNQLSGNIPAEISNLSNLILLFLDQNQFTGSVPSSLGSITKLRQVDLGENFLEGSIPIELSQITELRTLKLGFNQLSGSIPKELGSMPYLWLLDLRSNNLTGTIPPELGNLQNADDTGITLNFAYNHLLGSIPQELGNLSRLNGLFLQDNELSGTIPDNLGNASGLQSLWLANNQDLFGSIPQSFTNLINLYEFYFHTTKLCEPDNTEFINWKATVTNWEGTGMVCQLIYLPTIVCTTDLSH